MKAAAGKYRKEYQLDIFSPSLPPASRAKDPPTAKAAGNIFEKRGISSLHEEILDAFKQHGPMTDEELERLAQFADLAPSTARKRRSELFHIGKLWQHDTVKNSRGRKMVRWTLGDPL